MWVAVAVGVLVVAAGSWWFLSLEPTGSACTASAFRGAPTGPDPEAAFVAWHGQFHRREPVDAFDRSEWAQWRLATSEGEWLQVDVAEQPGGQWAVAGVNECWEVPAD